MLEIKTKLEGRFEWELLDRSGKVVRRGGSENLVLDQGLQLAAQYAGSCTYWNTDHMYCGLQRFLAYVAVGTGNSAPDVTQTALDNEVGRTHVDLGLGAEQSWTDVSDGVYEMTVTRAFDYGEANGDLKELGGATADSGELATRALFKDGSGNPTTITKTNENRLVITYTLRITITPTTVTDGPDITWYDKDGSTVQMTKKSKVCFIGVQQSSALSKKNGDVAVTCGHRDGYYAGAYHIALFYADFTQGYSTVPTIDVLALADTSYNAGDTFKDLEATLQPETVDRMIYGFGLATHSSESGTILGWTARFVDNNGDADPITKDKDYKIKFGVRLSYDR